MARTPRPSWAVTDFARDLLEKRVISPQKLGFFSYGVLVAYGTSQRVGELFTGEFAITAADAAAYKLAGLSFPTKFNLRQRVLLPYTHDWFAMPPAAPHGLLPRLGTLHPSLLIRFRAAAGAAGLLQAWRG